MAVGLSSEVRDEMMKALMYALAGGSLCLYDGTRPKTGGQPGKLLAKVMISSGSVDDGVLTLTPSAEEATAEAEGAPMWARLFSRNGPFVADLTVGEEVKIKEEKVEKGQSVRLVSVVLVEGNP